MLGLAIIECMLLLLVVPEVFVETVKTIFSGELDFFPSIQLNTTFFSKRFSTPVQHGKCADSQNGSLQQSIRNAHRLTISSALKEYLV